MFKKKLKNNIFNLVSRAHNRPIVGALAPTGSELATPGIEPRQKNSIFKWMKKSPNDFFRNTFIHSNRPIKSRKKSL